MQEPARCSFEDFSSVQHELQSALIAERRPVVLYGVPRSVADPFCLDFIRKHAPETWMQQNTAQRGFGTVVGTIPTKVSTFGVRSECVRRLKGNCDTGEVGDNGERDGENGDVGDKGENIGEKGESGEKGD